MSYEEARAKAQQALDSKDPQGAFSALRSVFDYPAPLLDSDERWSEALAQLATAVEPLAGAELAETIRRTASAASDPSALFDAAFALYDHSLFAIAGSLLTRANRLHPGDKKIVTELSSCLEAVGANGEAARVIAASGLAETDPFCSYLLGFNMLMSGDVEGARERGATLDDSTVPEIMFARNALAGMVARADTMKAATKLDDFDLTGWHLVINGALLLHESPHGHDGPMRGRYAYVGDSYGLMREGIERVKLSLEVAGHQPDRVIALPDRSSQILGRATAHVLDIDFDSWRPKETRPGLLVAYDLDLVGDAEVLGHLRAHRTGQLLWAHAGSWVDPFPFTPDLQTFLYQSCTSPWAGGALKIDAETKQVVPSQPDDSDPQAIAERIVDAEIRDGSVTSVEQLTALIECAIPLPGSFAAALFRTEGPRAQQRTGSPVPSARFA